MSRQIVQLHTIQQWAGLDSSIKSVILQNIKLKDRLQRFLIERNELRSSQPGLDQPRWAPCRSCEKKGWVLHHPRYPGIHPSQLGHPCLLKIYNEMVGIKGKEKIEPKSQLIFDLGHAVHAMFQGYGDSGAWGPHYEKEVELSEDHQPLCKELMIEGHADAENLLIIDDIPNAPIYEVGLIHEYKTINSQGFEKLRKPKPEHITQAMVYAAALNRPIVVYLYFNKNDSNLMDFPVPFDAELWAPIEAKARTLNDHFNQEIAPPATPGFHCQYCPHVYDCEAYALYSKKGK